MLEWLLTETNHVVTRHEVICFMLLLVYSITTALTLLWRFLQDRRYGPRRRYQDWKRFQYAQMYGGSIKTLADQLNVTEDAVERLTKAGKDNG